ncbi:fumarylacetoacetate hydrolase family protein [Amycolatopsis rhizosphaerae]|uniref:Fumarylacetoacetate hydrolase family protein n=1 Tax=Amycolatopsis rhizosphaerae TaxID=2053003 RepID=A0A558DBQ8_9PSEU|nr:fumarylacetoacetate hydrolase family protein [Amycolatopsis rhizosphaerae]TVT58459.1 fumarylacetoacetate hydrolase family protein [Amycolatopsis rhizosphaerae]
MRYATIRHAGTTAAARVDGGRLVVLDAVDAVAAMASHTPVKAVTELDPATAEYLPVSPRPAHVLCVGLNYRDHIRALRRPEPAFPALFAKFASTLLGPADPLVLPAVSEQADWEAELAIVIGRPARGLDPAQARSVIAGYTVANDVSMRDWQHRTSEALQGKAFDRSTPLGPVLVSPGALDDARDLAVVCEIDGQVRQRGTTRDLLFRPAELVAYISRFLTLLPGDVILTGTPGGVGEETGTFLRPGQVMRTTVESIGTCVNPTVAAAH